MKSPQKKTIVVYGEHKKAMQAMIDYDYTLGKDAPSLVSVIGVSDKIQVYKWGNVTITIPVYTKLEDYKDAGSVWGAVVMVSSRNVLSVVRGILKTHIKNIFILAENVPERDARILRQEAKKAGATIIGPASVGVLYAGDIKISHAGGLIENVVREKLYIEGTVGIVSKSGGMLNELMSTVTRSGARVHTAIAIGGDRYPITRMAEAVLLLSQNKAIETIVVLGEIGGTQENELALLLEEGKISQKVIVHILGAGSKHFDSTIQFGHAGAMAGNEEETPEYKIQTLKKAGAVIVEDFADLGSALLRETKHLTRDGDEKPKRNTPKDFEDALVSGEVRYSPHFTTTVNLDYEMVKKNSLGHVVCSLWFGIEVPDTVATYVEFILKMLADHGALVSGAHNTIVASRAGKDLVSSLASGLLTIGPRFGGAINAAGEYVFAAVQEGMTPEDFVATMKKQNIPIPGIGHRVYSATDNDPRVLELCAYVEKHFSSHKHLSYFRKVEALTLAKRDNLIMNVDGCIAVTLLDIFEELHIDKSKVKKYLDAEAFNGLFVLSRSIGLIAHHIDQVSLGEGLYRHPEYDLFKKKRDDGLY